MCFQSAERCCNAGSLTWITNADMSRRTVHPEQPGVSNRHVAIGPRPEARGPRPEDGRWPRPSGCPAATALHGDQHGGGGDEHGPPHGVWIVRRAEPSMTESPDD